MVLKNSTKFLATLLLITMLLTLTGCEDPIKSKSEIKNMFFNNTSGVEKSEAIKDGVKLTFLFDIPEAGKEGQRIEEYIITEGKTIFEAHRNMGPILNGNYYEGGTKYYIIGEDIAKESLNKCIDFRMRDHMNRLDTKVFVTQGATPREIMEIGETESRSIKDTIAGLEANIGGISVTSTIDVMQLIKDMDNKTKAPVIPVLKINKIAPGTDSGQDKTRIKLGGYGVFKNDKLIGFLTDEQSRGLNWVTNKITSNLYVVESSEFGRVSLEIVGSSAKIVPKISGEKLSAEFKINFHTIIGEQYEQYDIYNKDSVAFMEKEVENLVTSEVKSAIKFAKENNVDIFGIGNKFFHQYPVRWENIKDDWVLKFSSLDIQVKVNAKITRTYDFREPVGLKGD